MSIIPIIFYLGLLTALPVLFQRSKTRKNSAAYFSGAKAMGAFFLAMTFISSYIGSSSVIGGPALAAHFGLSWIYLAMIQPPTMLLVLAFVALPLSRRARGKNWVSLNEFFLERYSSPFLYKSAAIVSLLFFTVMICVEYMGAAKLVSTITSLSYTQALIFFVLTVMIYTSIGGLDAVVLSDVIQGVLLIFLFLLLLGALLLWPLLFHTTPLLSQIQLHSPSKLSPLAGGALSKSFIFSFWGLVGVGMLGFPQRTFITLTSDKAIYKAMIIGTLLFPLLLFVPHFIALLGSPLVPSAQNDQTMGQLLERVGQSPLIIGSLAALLSGAILSSVDTLTLNVSSIVVRDLSLPWKNSSVSPKAARIAVLAISAVALIMALFPPPFLSFLSLLALGAFEVSLTFPLVLGLHTKRFSKAGALCSFWIGLGAYLVAYELPHSLHTPHPSLWGLLASALTAALFLLFPFKK